MNTLTVADTARADAVDMAAYTAGAPAAECECAACADSYAVATGDEECADCGRIGPAVHAA